MTNPVIHSIAKLLYNSEIEDKKRFYEIQKIIAEQNPFNTENKNAKSLKELCQLKIETIENYAKNYNVISTGFKNLDEKINGLCLSEFIVIGARPCMGKTTFFINLALQISKINPVLYFTYECSDSEISLRMMSSLTGIPCVKLIQNDVINNDLECLNRIEKESSNYQIYVNEGYSNSVTELKNYCEKMKIEKGVKVVFIESIQRMSSNQYGNRREAEIASISRGLKQIAKELNICVIAASQLSRAVESRGGDKRPYLSDLRDSGSIEQDADKVLMVYRPEYYGIFYNEMTESNINKMELIIEKNKTGDKGVVNFFCDFKTFRISEFEYDFIPSVLNLSDNKFHFFDDRLGEIDSAPF